MDVNYELFKQLFKQQNISISNEKNSNKIYELGKQKINEFRYIKENSNKLIKFILKDNNSHNRLINQEKQKIFQKCQKQIEKLQSQKQYLRQYFKHAYNQILRKQIIKDQAFKKISLQTMIVEVLNTPNDNQQQKQKNRKKAALLAASYTSFIQHTPDALNQLILKLNKQISNLNNQIQNLRQQLTPLKLYQKQLQLIISQKQKSDLLFQKNKQHNKANISSIFVEDQNYDFDNGSKGPPSAIHDEIIIKQQQNNKNKIELKIIDYKLIPIQIITINKQTQTNKLQYNNFSIQTYEQKSQQQIQIQINQETISTQTQIHIQQKSIQASYNQQQTSIQTQFNFQSQQNIIQNLKQKIQTLQQQKIDKESINKQNIDNLNQNIKSLNHQIIKLKYSSLFVGNVFDNNEKYKNMLIQHIQNKSKHKIQKTKLIYKYDPLNHTNFHHYIDQIQGIALLVKIKQDFYVAGYYSGKLTQSVVMSQFGLLISMSSNHNQSYDLLQPQKNNNKALRTMTYDTFYCIFGNAQLRIKSGQNTIFSNFGIMNSYFKHNGHKVNQFLGGGQNRQIKFLTYQFYQIILNK